MKITFGYNGSFSAEIPDKWECVRWRDLYPKLAKLAESERQKSIKPASLSKSHKLTFKSPIGAELDKIFYELPKAIKHHNSPHKWFFKALIQQQMSDPLSFLDKPAVIPELNLNTWKLSYRLDIAVLDNRNGLPIGIEIDGRSHYEPVTDDNEQDKSVGTGETSQTTKEAPQDPVFTFKEREQAFTNHTKRARDIGKSFRLIHFTNYEIRECMPTRYPHQHDDNFKELKPLLKEIPENVWGL